MAAAEKHEASLVRFDYEDQRETALRWFERHRWSAALRGQAEACPRRLFVDYRIRIRPFIPAG